MQNQINRLFEENMEMIRRRRIEIAISGARDQSRDSRERGALARGITRNIFDRLLGEDTSDE